MHVRCFVNSSYTLKTLPCLNKSSINQSINHGQVALQHKKDIIISLHLLRFSRILLANAHEFILSSTDFRDRHFLEPFPKTEVISSTYFQFEFFCEDTESQRGHLLL